MAAEAPDTPLRAVASSAAGSHYVAEREPWGVLLAAATGQAFSMVVMMAPLLTVLFKAVTEEFQWSRAQYSLALTISTAANFVAGPTIGWAVDHLGTRRVILATLALQVVAVSSIRWLTPSLWHFYALMSLLPFVSWGASSASFPKVINAWFTRRRGFALGCLTAAVGVGGVIHPLSADWGLRSFGWRNTGLLFAAQILFVALPVVFFWVKERPDTASTSEPAGTDTQARMPSDANGLAVREALRDRSFWWMTAAYALHGFAFMGTLMHLVPLLTDRGVDSTTAAAAFSLTMLGLLIGNLTIGLLLDRFDAKWLAIAFLAAPAAALLSFAAGAVGSIALGTALLFGFGAGCEGAAVMYLIGRYFGQTSFGQVFAWHFSLTGVGAALGPLVAGLVFDRSGSYQAALLPFAFCIVAAAGCLTRMGRYRF